MVAQRYNLNANQVFKWRRQFREPERAGVAGRFVPVVVDAAPGQEPAPASASFNIETICVSVNRLRLMGTSWLDYRA